MMHVLAEVNDETIDALLVNSLRGTIDIFLNPMSIPHFSHDKEEEAKEIKKVLKALIRVHNYYSVEEDHLSYKELTNENTSNS